MTTTGDAMTLVAQESDRMAEGAVSPKVTAATVGAVVAAILGYVLTQTVLDLPGVVEVAINAVLVGLAALGIGYGARPGRVMVDPASATTYNPPTGSAAL